MARPATDPKRDRQTLLDQPTRRAIARACCLRPHSVAELERSLGRKSLQAIVGRLEQWDVLVPAGTTPRGSQRFSLAKTWEQDLDAAISRSNLMSFSGQRLVLIGKSDISAAAACLARQHAGDLSWVGVLGQGDGLLVGVEDAREPSPSELRQSLLDAGIECELTSVDEPATGEEIEPYLRGLGAAGTS
jgi:hypothetical protein